MTGGHQRANEDEIQSKGRKDNAAQPLNAAEPNAGAERYPSAGKDDAVEAPPPAPNAGDGKR